MLTETALELPYRLILSPAHHVAWQHALGLKSHAGRTELWHTRLMLRDANGTPVPISRQNPAPLRAIWSPDYKSTRFFNTDPPLMGDPDKDWDFPPGVLTAMTPSDRHGDSGSSTRAQATAVATSARTAAPRRMSRRGVSAT